MNIFECELRYRTVIMHLFVVAEQNLNVITIHSVIRRIVTTEGEECGEESVMWGKDSHLSLFTTQAGTLA